LENKGDKSFHQDQVPKVCPGDSKTSKMIGFCALHDRRFERILVG